jgi:hypothetical protein
VDDDIEADEPSLTTTSAKDEDEDLDALARERFGPDPFVFGNYDDRDDREPSPAQRVLHAPVSSTAYTSPSRCRFTRARSPSRTSSASSA